MERPSRSKMLQHKPKRNLIPNKPGDYKIQEKYNKGLSKDLVISCSSVTPEFIEAFCAEHSITFRIQGKYYYLS